MTHKYESVVNWGRELKRGNVGEAQSDAQVVVCRGDNRPVKTTLPPPLAMLD